MASQRPESLPAHTPLEAININKVKNYYNPTKQKQSPMNPTD
ncbi:protein of unknown function [Shewanella benthica]|uniref:Uncharacterized protein n=1 Tax=Shewanella benthica TaxID=43661 RepID=A0A330LXD8_9GAMM|nr:protein of unknown function [Shewanella benthica]